MRGVRSLAAGLVVLALPSAAVAEPIETDRFEPSRQLELLGVQGVDIDTGWQPPASAIQVSFVLRVDDDIVASLPGEAIYDWEAQEIHFEGDEGEGVFDVGVGVVLDARLRFDLLGNVFESELIGPYELGVFEATEFTPYLLESNPDRPARVAKMTEPFEVFNYALVDALVASGNFIVEAAFDVDVALECDAIEVTGDATQVANATVELASESLLAPGDGRDLEVEARLRCTTVSDVTVLLYPGVEIQIGLEEFELTPFALPVPVLVDQRDPLDFEPLPLAFPAPPPPSGATSDEESGGGEGTSAGEAPGADESSTGSSGGEDDGASADSAAGCGCRGGHRGSGILLLAFVAAIALRRRRS